VSVTAPIQCQCPARDDRSRPDPAQPDEDEGYEAVSPAAQEAQGVLFAGMY
jgi:hypothetical protein